MAREILTGIARYATEASARVDLAIMNSELAGDHPTLSELKFAFQALDKIRLSAELDQVPRADESAQIDLL